MNYFFSFRKGNNMAKVKRTPAPPKGKKGNKSKKTKNGVGNKVSTKKKDDAKTVFNSSLDTKLATIDAYQNLGNTVNSLYQFTNTMSLTSITDAIKGGLNGLNKINEYLKMAKDVSEGLKNGNLMDRVGSLAPGAKAALQSAGLDPAMFDKVQAAAKIGNDVVSTVKDVRSGKLDILNGLNNLGKAITGQDIGLIKDIQAFKASAAAIVKEFSSAGIAIRDNWYSLVGHRDKDGYEYNVAMDVATTVMDDLLEYGDYDTAKIAIKSINPQKLKEITGDSIEKMLKNFSMNSVFNLGRTEQDVFNDVLSTIEAFDNGNYLWVDRESNRKLFNVRLFMSASEDFKRIAKVSLADRFFLDSHVKKLLDYTDKENEVLLLLGNVFTNISDFKTELNKDFPNFIVNERQQTVSIISPDAFKINNA